MLELGEEDPRLRPLAVLAEGDIADHGLEGVAVHVGGDLDLIEALGVFDRLGQHLSRGIAERREGPADRIDALGLRRRSGTSPARSVVPGNVRVGAGRNTSLLTMPFISGPSCALIGVTRSPMKVPPNIFGVSPISLAARMMPTESGG